MDQWVQPVRLRGASRQPRRCRRRRMLGCEALDRVPEWLTYYDFRSNTTAPGVPTDYWIVHCHASCANASSWGQRAAADDELVRHRARSRRPGPVRLLRRRLRGADARGRDVRAGVRGRQRRQASEPDGHLLQHGEPLTRSGRGWGTMLPRPGGRAVPRGTHLGKPGVVRRQRVRLQPVLRARKGRPMREAADAAWSEPERTRFPIPARMVPGKMKPAAG